MNDTPQQTNPQPGRAPAQPGRPLAQPGRSLTAGKPVRPMIPVEGTDVRNLAVTIFESQLAPFYLKNWQAVAVVMMYGAELGIPPMQSMAGIAVINGRPVLWGDLGMAVIRDSGLVESWVETFTGKPYEDDFTAHCKVKRRGDPEWHEVSFSVADAKLAKLWGKLTKNGEPTPWVTHPKRMMMWRARNVFRDVFPDVTKGFRFREEAQDDVPEDIVERSQASGLADRLQAATGGPGFADGHVERELQGPASASEPVQATQEPPATENAPTAAQQTGKGHPEGGDPVEATDADFAEVDDPAAGQPAGEGSAPDGTATDSLNDEEKANLDQLSIDLASASSILEVGGVWAMWQEAFSHLSESARKLALELVEMRKTQISQNPKRTRTRKPS